MQYGSRSIAAFLVLVTLAGCASPPAAPTEAPPSGQLSAPAPAVISNRTLNIIMRVEPQTMLEGSVDRSAVHKPLFTANLGAWSLQEVPYPVLAEAIPQLNTDTWRVLPDGRMETVYRLRAGLTWHDGTPLTADDVAFTKRVALTRIERGLDQPSAEYRQIEDIVAA